MTDRPTDADVLNWRADMLALMRLGAHDRDSYLDAVARIEQRDAIPALLSCLEAGASLVRIFNTAEAQGQVRSGDDVTTAMINAIRDLQAGNKDDDPDDDG